MTVGPIGRTLGIGALLVTISSPFYTPEIITVSVAAFLLAVFAALTLKYFQ